MARLHVMSSKTAILVCPGIRSLYEKKIGREGVARPKGKKEKTVLLCLLRGNFLMV